jgi:tartrate-resistant acid phosphatase type 5
VAVAPRARRHPRPEPRLNAVRACLAAALALLPAAALAPPAARAAGGPGTVHFAVKGDWGAGTSAQAAVTRRMCAVAATRPFAFVLTTGDNFYGPDGQATAANFTRPEACLLSAGVRWRAAWGNHDLSGDSTARVLGSPRRYSTFATGPLRVVVLDANRPTDPAQLAFMRRTLAAATEPALVVAFHQPVYSAGLHQPVAAQQRLWAPIFRRYRVSLVLQGHNHQYERAVVGGVTYITTGGGGAPLYPCLRPFAGLVRCVPVHHFLDVTATSGALDVAAVQPGGQVLDRVSIPLPASRGPAAP